jgi:histidinol-phosphatase
MKGIHIWGTLLSLNDKSGELFSYISAPGLNCVWISIRGNGCWKYIPRNRLWVRLQNFENNLLTKDLGFFSTSDFRDLDSYEELFRVKNNLNQFKKVRAFGDFLSHCYVAEKSVQFAVSTKTKIWDYSALKLLISESGGKYFIYKTQNDLEIFISTNLEDSKLKILMTR